jgi:hypothetical protein
MVKKPQANKQTTDHIDSTWKLHCLPQTKQSKWHNTIQVAASSRCAKLFLIEAVRSMAKSSYKDKPEKDSVFTYNSSILKYGFYWKIG